MKSIRVSSARFILTHPLIHLQQRWVLLEASPCQQRVVPLPSHRDAELERDTGLLGVWGQSLEMGDTSLAVTPSTCPLFPSGAETVFNLGRSFLRCHLTAGQSGEIISISSRF